jgi:hypothetical protein
MRRQKSVARSAKRVVEDEELRLRRAMDLRFG